MNKEEMEGEEEKKRKRGDKEGELRGDEEEKDK